ncbi:hypothetical protein XAPC_4032 [Xanthomonas citri pv. punicae str. LMG 859]|nr:hypothetical protein XAPC_4032 [Xanthomonas citri pv. punicae str. LMG 859]
MGLAAGAAGGIRPSCWQQPERGSAARACACSSCGTPTAARSAPCCIATPRPSDTRGRSCAVPGLPSLPRTAAAQGLALIGWRSALSSAVPQQCV